jgi:hypothetical protein
MQRRRRERPAALGECAGEGLRTVIAGSATQAGPHRRLLLRAQWPEPHPTVPPWQSLRQPPVVAERLVSRDATGEGQRAGATQHQKPSPGRKGICPSIRALPLRQVYLSRTCCGAGSLSSRCNPSALTPPAPAPPPAWSCGGRGCGLPSRVRKHMGNRPGFGGVLSRAHRSAAPSRHHRPPGHSACPCHGPSCS